MLPGRNIKMNQFKCLTNRLASIVVLLLSPLAAQAETLDSGDTAWIMTSTALVLFMTLPGLALFYGGLVRSKNVLSVLMQCFVIACVVTIVWVVYGYSLSFAEGSSWVGGLSNAFLGEVTRESMTGNRIRYVPADLRDHYTGTGCRRLCRAHEVLLHAGIQCFLGQPGLFPGMPLGMGWRLAG